MNNTLIRKLKELVSTNQGVRLVDLSDPFYFFLSCIVNKQIPLDKAWSFPYLLAERLNTDRLTPKMLADLPVDIIESAIMQKPALHRFKYIAQEIKLAADYIEKSFNGKPRILWNTSRSISELHNRLTVIKGVGHKIAFMMIMFLIQQNELPLIQDTSSAELPIDTHVKRVSQRLGVPLDQLQHLAKEVSPTFPALLDDVLFDIGITICKPRKPLCYKCPLKNCCPSLNT